MNSEKSYESNRVNNALFKPLVRLNNSIYNLLLPKTQELEDKDKIIHDLKIKIADNESHFILELEEKNKIIDDLKIKIADNKSHFILELEEKNKIINDLKIKANEHYLFKQIVNKQQLVNDLKIKIADNERHFFKQVLNKNKDINDLKIKIEDKNKIIHNQRLTLINKNKDINDLKIKLDEKNKNDEINKCSICLDNTISYCCSPCGHTYCSDCIKKTNNCYICRGIIHNKIKIYL